MEIIIKQERTYSATEYAIEYSGSIRYYAYQRSRGGYRVYDIVSLRNVQPQIFVEIKKMTKWFRPDWFEITLKGQESVVFQKPEKGANYQLSVQEDTYEVLGHKYLNASIFKNKQQVGFLSKMNIASFRGKDNFKLLMDYDVNLAILLSLSIIWGDLYYSRSGGQSLINIDLGSFTEKQAANLNWRPKKKEDQE